MTKFKRNDIVRLKSGGDDMTVVGTYSDMVECIWDDDQGNVYSDHFPEDSLIGVKDAEDVSSKKRKSLF